MKNTKKQIKFYQLDYLRNVDSFSKKFRKFSSFRLFIQNMSPDKLNYTRPMMYKDGFLRIGKYFILKKGGLSVKF